MSNGETVHYTVKELFEKIDRRLEQVDKKLDDRLRDLEQRVQALELSRAERAPLPTVVQSLDSRLDAVEKKIVWAAASVSAIVSTVGVIASFFFNYFL